MARFHQICMLVLNFKMLKVIKVFSPSNCKQKTSFKQACDKTLSNRHSSECFVSITIEKMLHSHLVPTYFSDWIL